jgi:glycosyltransferase involved in cell wall biosynthesis
MKLIIQIPCYNEEKTLHIALNALPRKLRGVDTIEYLIIDDGSRDGTARVARKWGVQHIVTFPQNRGLARGFMAGLDEALRCGADIIVNTDADNQYSADDIQTLIDPILKGKADYVIGARPINEIQHFSKGKKLLQHFGSWAVRRASHTDIPDAPSGFRALSRECAMHINVVNDFTYTLETIVQAGREKMAVISVPIHTNEELRPSRLSRSIWDYVKRSVLTILRAYMMYKPLMSFTYIGMVPASIGLLIGVRFLVFMAGGNGGGHVQSLILACMLIIIGFLTFMIGLLADLLAGNRRILQDAQYHARKSEYDQILIDQDKKQGR